MGENFKEKNNEAAEAKAEGNNAVLNGNESEATPQKLTDEQKYAKKYLFMREKLLKNYDIGCKKYRKAKITTAIIFLVISVLFTVLSIGTGRHMQFLTVWSLLLTIPTIVTGFFGMNVDLPIFHNPFDWVIITVGSIIVMAILLWYLRRHNML